MKKRIGIWIRVSTEEQAKGESPEHHLERAKMYANLQEWLIVEEYHLEAVSGKSVMHHPEAQRMVNDIKRGHIDGLIFSKLARLARNTRELLDFSEIFRHYNADLISLEEKIDTSSPAGRFFYTLISAMSQWEREEISSRVQASVPIRAKLGKSLGGETPFGYQQEKGRPLELHPTEAPIRILIYELFAQYKRKKFVVKLLNERGYRTRNGNFFTDTTIDRILRDPIAKGIRRVNYTKAVSGQKHWELKPKEDWVFVPVPRLVSDELWQTCNDILDSMAQKHNKVRSRGVYLFAGVLTCQCGSKMYMRAKSPRYICKVCKNKIEPDILEEVFREQLKTFLFSDTEIQKKIDADKNILKNKTRLKDVLEQEVVKLNERIKKIFELYYDNKLTKDTFEEHHQPLYKEQQQKLAEIADIQSTLDVLSLNSLSNDQVLLDAKNLYKQWNNFSNEDKKDIIESVVKNITIGADEIDIELSYLPTLKAEPTQTTGGSSYTIDPMNQYRHRFFEGNHSDFPTGEIKQRNHMDVEETECQDFKVKVVHFTISTLNGTQLYDIDLSSASVENTIINIGNGSDPIITFNIDYTGAEDFILSSIGPKKFETINSINLELFETPTSTEKIIPQQNEYDFTCEDLSKHKGIQEYSYTVCKYDNADPFKLIITNNATNINNPGTDLTTAPSNPIHFFKIRRNGVDVTTTLSPEFFSHTTSTLETVYKLPYYFYPLNPDDFSVDCDDNYKFYTDYELTICEFRNCPGNACNKCREMFTQFDHNEATTKTVKIRVYRPLTDVNVDVKNPCEARSITMPNFFTSTQDNRYGHLIIDMCERKGGYASNYNIELCMDTEPNDGIFDNNCAVCKTLKWKKNDPQPVGFYGLTKGDYLLTITSANPDYDNCGTFVEEYHLDFLNTVPFSISPNPAFICPGTPAPSVELEASTDDFTNYAWTHICDNSTASGYSITVPQGEGGTYTLTATDNNNCSRTAEAVVIDLTLPNIEYPLIDNVIQVGASKYEHITTPELASTSWESAQEIKDFDQMNSYISGFSGIYRPKETFDYLDNRSSTALAHGNINIKESGTFNDVAVFNWSHPSFLVCADKWKLNATITKFNPSSYGLESKDILGLYSSGLYGYKGMLPIAQSGLGKFHEIAFESFEEYIDASMNQLNNPSGNFDFVKQIASGSVLYYEEYPIVLGQNNYAIIDMQMPANCPNDAIKADVICRSVSGESTPGCNGIKLKEGEIKNIDVTILNNPCEDGPSGVLGVFPKALVPPFLPSPDDECLQWNGILRVKREKVYQAESFDRVSFPSGVGHTGTKCMQINGSGNTTPLPAPVTFQNLDIHLEPNTEYILSLWVKTDGSDNKSIEALDVFNKTNNINISLATGSISFGGNTFFPTGKAINGWQKIDAVFKTGLIGGAASITFDPAVNMYVDDVRLSPLNGGMQTYVYNPENYRLLATLDANNYATVYKYDDEGNLFTVQKETVEGYKTIQLSQSYIHPK
ncbi:MAG: recombinase family protein [Chitinophagales bacterium]|nr:recombinase family protein [Chitinophagales bacterium]